MKLKYVFILNTVVSIAYVLGAFLIPQTVLDWHGFATDASTVWVGRFFAVELLGVGLVTWLARNSEVNSVRGTIVLGLMLHDVVGAIVAIWATLTGGMSALGWLPTAIYVLLALGYAYFYFGQSSS